VSSRRESRVEAGEEIMLGLAADRPAALVELLRTHLRARGDVDRARLAQIFVPSSGVEPHPIVGIATPRFEEVLRDLGALVAEGYDGEVDFVPLDEHEVGAWLDEHGEDLLRPSTVRTHNALEEAILSGDVEALLPVLADAEVYVPADAAGVAASSLEQFARLRPEGGEYVALAGRALAAAMPGPLALNPGSDLAVGLTAEQVERLQQLPPGGEPELLVGEPREEPIEVLEAIRGFAAARADVRAAYRGLLVRRPGSEAEPVVGLELEDGADAAAAIDAAAEAARDAGVDRLALVAIGDGGPVARFLVEQTRPFWRREA
jgi:SseB protein C-terminal domain